MNITFEITPKYIKSENFIINLIIDDLLKKKKLVYTLEELNIPELKGSHFLFLERFIKKGMLYSFKDNSGVFMPIESFFISDNYVHFNLTEIFKGAILEENDLKILDLKYILKFEESFTKYFYYNFVINTEKEKSLIIPLDELRTLLGLKEYDRFYDFELNILKKLKKDIDLKTNFLLEYNKIKNGEFKNNKVVAIEFIINNKESKIKTEQTNELMGILAHHIKDFKFSYDLLYKALSYVEFNELKNSVHYILKNHNKKLTLEEELSIFINNKFKLSHYKKIDSFHASCSNPLKFQNFLYNKLNDMIDLEVLNTNVSSTKFLKMLYFAKDGEQIFFEDGDIIIAIKYSKKSDSFFEIYKKIK